MFELRDLGGQLAASLAFTAPDPAQCDEAGLEPDGFVAPAYTYTASLRDALARRFRWWADLWRIHRLPATAGARSPLAPAWVLGSDGVLQRALSPLLVRAGGLLCGEVLRVGPRKFARLAPGAP